MTIPAPMPRMQLTAMSCVIVRAKRHATPLIKNMARPARSSAILLRATDSRPDNRIKGMISTEGIDVSICISRLLTCGKILFRSPIMGDTASPGSDTTAETDQMAMTTASDTLPFPVCICIISRC